jgi:hypothetical protein
MVLVQCVGKMKQLPYIHIWTQTPHKLIKPLIKVLNRYYRHKLASKD